MQVFDPQILIVEDNSDDVLILEHALRMAGVVAHIHVCRDGQDAMDYLKAAGRYQDRSKFPFPRLLISDLKMPRCSGLELLQWMQRHPTCSVVPVLILSTSAQAQDVAEAYRLGANTFFQKPVGIEPLARMLRDTVAYWGHAILPNMPERCE